MRRSSLPNAATGVADVEASTSKPSGAFDDLVAVAHPHVLRGRLPGEQHSAVARERGIRRPVLAQAGVGDLAAERLRHDLEAVADAERGDAEVEDAGVERRGARLVHRRRSAREDDADRVLGRDVGRRWRCAARSRCRRRLRGRGGRSAARTARRSRRRARGAGRSRSVRSPLVLRRDRVGQGRVLGRACSSASSRSCRYARTSRADARLEEEREERDDAARGEQQEAPERPAHEAPHAEAGEEVDDVEPAVRDQDAERQVEAVAGGLVAVRALDDRREPEESARSAEEQLVAEGVLRRTSRRTAAAASCR